MFYGNCPYWNCPNRNELGYCKTTTCINPKYQSNTVGQDEIDDMPAIVPAEGGTNDG